MESANQLYKSSGSKLAFKEWLKREQLKGKLEVHEDKYLNANGQRDGGTPECVLWKPAVVGAVIGFGIGYFIAKRRG